ncbi:MAG: hypothetical protein V3V00_15810 [Saprospiraceae bacterium]
MILASEPTWNELSPEDEFKFLYGVNMSNKRNEGESFEDYKFRMRKAKNTDDDSKHGELVHNSSDSFVDKDNYSKIKIVDGTYNAGRNKAKRERRAK